MTIPKKYRVSHETALQMLPDEGNDTDNREAIFQYDDLSATILNQLEWLQETAALVTPRRRTPSI